MCCGRFRVGCSVNLGLGFMTIPLFDRRKNYIYNVHCKSFDYYRLFCFCASTSHRQQYHESVMQIESMTINDTEFMHQVLLHVCRAQSDRFQMLGSDEALLFEKVSEVAELVFRQESFDVFRCSSLSRLCQCRCCVIGEHVAEKGDLDADQRRRWSRSRLCVNGMLRALTGLCQSLWL